MIDNLPTFNDVLKAEKRLGGLAVRTPLLTSPLLDERCGGRIFLKAENLQRTGSFKFRGAFNAISALVEQHLDLKKKGVIACSSGNHAQGVAEAARLHNLPATIVMPVDAPAIKIARTRRSGANVVFYDRATEDRDEVSKFHAERTGAVFIHPFNEPLVIAGQGTCALEAVRDFGVHDIIPDRVLVCTGGGGLSAGVALVMKEHFPKAAFHTVEPVGFDDYNRSLAVGERLSNVTTAGSICDAIVTPMPGERSFEILHGYASPGLIVSDEEALAAVAFAFHELKTVLEPGGAVTLAALLSGRINVRGQTVLATLSGGNIDPEMMERALSLA